MMQKVKIPDVMNCAVCGAKARVIDWDFWDCRYRVYCDNNHTATKECGTVNRAIHRWNKKQLQAMEELAAQAQQLQMGYE